MIQYSPDYFKKKSNEKTKIVAILLLTTTVTFAQNKTVEKSVWNAQAGLYQYGVFISNELGLTNALALRTEIGLVTNYISSSPFSNNGFVIAPNFTIEPRWYYNIEKRANNGRKTAGNSANFFALATTYDNDVFQINAATGLFTRPRNELLIVPRFGIRRVYNHFNFEVGAGAGLITFFGDSRAYWSKPKDLVVTANILIGFNL